MLNKNKLRETPKGIKANLFFIVKDFKELEFIAVKAIFFIKTVAAFLKRKRRFHFGINLVKAFFCNGNKACHII